MTSVYLRGIDITDAFVIQGECETTVDLAGRHATRTLEDLDLDLDEAEAE